MACLHLDILFLLLAFALLVAAGMPEAALQRRLRQA
jgi:hypothetical protein